MKSFLILLGIVTLALSPTALAEEPEVEIQETYLSWEQAALSDGEALFSELCAACHGRTGTGDGPAVEALSIAVPDLTTMTRTNQGVFPAEKTEKAIRGELPIAAHGSTDMPIWGMAFRDVRPDWKPYQREGFAELRIRALVAYVESIQVEGESE